jgi:hypothetical protein
VRVQNATAVLEIIESDQTPPAGEWRLFASGGQLNFQRATGAGFSSTENLIQLGSGSAVRIGVSGSTLGFFGSLGGAKQDVTGSRGGNAALASLLTALEAYYIITDSTT